LAARFSGENLGLSLVNDQVYLDRKLMRERKADPSDVEQANAAALMELPGVANAFTWTQILRGQLPAGMIGQRVANGFNPAWSGDVWMITKPFHFVAKGEPATTHGSAYNYDTHVPIILCGAPVKEGRYYSECSPTDIAPTRCALPGVEPPPSRTGRVLTEALKQP
jgi:hypothetical protein